MPKYVPPITYLTFSCSELNRANDEVSNLLLKFNGYNDNGFMGLNIDESEKLYERPLMYRSNLALPIKCLKMDNNQVDISIYGMVSIKGHSIAFKKTFP